MNRKNNKNWIKQKTVKICQKKLKNQKKIILI